MSSTLIVPKWKAIATNDLATITKSYTNLIAGKHEIIYRKFIRDTLNIDCLRKKATTKSSGDEPGPDDFYSNKVNVYNHGSGFASDDNLAIKEIKQYILFATLLMVNYEKPTVKSFVDNCNNELNYKFSIINEQFGLLNNGGSNGDTYSYFNAIESNCHSQLVKILDKISENKYTITQEVHDRCIKAAFKDVASAYTYDKASTYCFNSYSQILNYASKCNDGQVLEDINTLYATAISMCTAKKATTSRGSKTTKNSKSKNVAETEDDELEDADDQVEL
jgi:hypothetical protein